MKKTALIFGIVVLVGLTLFFAACRNPAAGRPPSGGAGNLRHIEIVGAQALMSVLDGPGVARLSAPFNAATPGLFRQDAGAGWARAKMLDEEGGELQISPPGIIRDISDSWIAMSFGDFMPGGNFMPRYNYIVSKDTGAAYSVDRLSAPLNFFLDDPIADDGRGGLIMSIGYQFSALEGLTARLKRVSFARGYPTEEFMTPPDVSSSLAAADSSGNIVYIIDPMRGDGYGIEFVLRFTDGQEVRIFDHPFWGGRYAHQLLASSMFTGPSGSIYTIPRWERHRGFPYILYRMVINGNTLDEVEFISVEIIGEEPLDAHWIDRLDPIPHFQSLSVTVFHALATFDRAGILLALYSDSRAVISRVPPHYHDQAVIGARHVFFADNWATPSDDGYQIRVFNRETGEIRGLVRWSEFPYAQGNLVIGDDTLIVRVPIVGTQGEFFPFDYYYLFLDGSMVPMTPIAPNQTRVIMRVR